MTDPVTNPPSFPVNAIFPVNRQGQVDTRAIHTKCNAEIAKLTDQLRETEIRLAEQVAIRRVASDMADKIDAGLVRQINEQADRLADQDQIELDRLRKAIRILAPLADTMDPDDPVGLAREIAARHRDASAAPKFHETGPFPFVDRDTEAANQVHADDKAMHDLASGGGIILPPNPQPSVPRITLGPDCRTFELFDSNGRKVELSVRSVHIEQAYDRSSTATIVLNRVEVDAQVESLTVKAPVVP